MKISKVKIHKSFNMTTRKLTIWNRNIDLMTGFGTGCSVESLLPLLFRNGPGTRSGKGYKAKLQKDSLVYLHEC